MGARAVAACVVLGLLGLVVSCGGRSTDSGLEPDAMPGVPDGSCGVVDKCTAEPIEEGPSLNGRLCKYRLRQFPQCAAAYRRYLQCWVDQELCPGTSDAGIDATDAGVTPCSGTLDAYTACTTVLANNAGK
jgi:hypothetical protein